MVVIMQDIQEIADLQKMKANATKIRMFVQMEINFIMGKNRSYSYAK